MRASLPALERTRVEALRPATLLPRDQRRANGLLVAKSAHAREDQVFIDRISER